MIYGASKWRLKVAGRALGKRLAKTGNGWAGALPFFDISWHLKGITALLTGI
jgi:hypothetical protein